MSVELEILDKVLDKIIRNAIKNKLLPNLMPQQIQELKHQVMHSLDKTNPDALRRHDFGNSQVIKALSFAVMATFILQKTPELKLNPALLFDKDLTLKPESLKKELKKIFRALNELQPEHKRLNEKQLDEQVDEFSLKLTKKMDEERVDVPAKSEEAVNCFEALLAETYRNIYGGQDPRGGAVYPVQAIIGNLIGLVDQGPGTSEYAIIDDGSRIDEKPDYLGTENATKIRKLSLGALGGGVAHELEEEGYLKPAPGSIKPPKPYGVD